MNNEKTKDLRQKITAGVKAAVASALEEHRRAGRLVAVWQDGRVRIVQPHRSSAEPTMVLQDKRQ